MKHDIFISYSRDDKALVIPFVEQISKAVKRDCWMDLKGIESGVEFEEVIMKAIDECQIVLFMLSDSSLKSLWAKREVYYAESQQKRIVPVLVNGDKLRGWFQFHFGNVDYISIRSNEHKEKLINNLRNWLGVDEEERKAAEEAKRIGHKSASGSTPSKREKLRLWIQKRKKWLAASFLTIIVIIGCSVYAYLHRIVEASDYHEGMARVENGMGYFGFKDESGKVVIPCGWKDAWPFSDGLARVMDASGKWGFIDKTGELVIPCQWKAAYDFSEGLAQVENNNDKWSFIDKTGKEVFSCQWKIAGYFSEGLAPVRDENEKWGYIDKTGELVIPCRWKTAWPFSEGLARVQDEDTKWGFIDKTGELVIPCRWGWAERFSEGLAQVMGEGDKWGYIDKTGKLVIPCQWEWAEKFSNGQASVQDDKEKWWKIDKTGKIVRED